MEFFPVTRIPVHLEKYEEKSVRFINYTLLSKVRFNGEPVVPAILSENSGNPGYFEVEYLKGLSLSGFLKLTEDKADLKTKLQVIRHVAGQYKAIDDAGFVIFDRHPLNVMVLGWANNKISTRQVDIEDMYDKSADAVYGEFDRQYYERYMEDVLRRGQDPWYLQISHLAITAFDILSDANRLDAGMTILNKLRNEWTTGERLLERFQDALPE